MNFRSANGLPVEDDLPGADELIARLPAPEPPPKIDDEDFSQHQVLDDLADDTEVDEHPAEADATHLGDAEEDFSHQRILADSMVESYRPDGTLDGVFEPSEPENPSSGHSSRRQPEVDG